MTQDELMQRATMLNLRHNANLGEIVRVARGLVSVLRDAQRENSAKELEQALFMHDAHEQEMAEFGRANIDDIMARLIGRGGVS